MDVVERIVWLLVNCFRGTEPGQESEGIDGSVIALNTASREAQWTLMLFFKSSSESRAASGR
jgi:hypothetical protein